MSDLVRNEEMQMLKYLCCRPLSLSLLIHRSSILTVFVFAQSDCGTSVIDCTAGTKPSVLACGETHLEVTGVLF